MLLCDLPISKATNNYTAEPVELNDWLNAWKILASHSEEQISVYQKTLRKIIASRCYLIIRDEEGVTVSCGMVVLSKDVLGKYGVVTGAANRRLGYGENLLQQLMYWGSYNGARYAYL